MNCDMAEITPETHENGHLFCHARKYAADQEQQAPQPQLAFTDIARAYLKTSAILMLFIDGCAVFLPIRCLPGPAY